MQVERIGAAVLVQQPLTIPGQASESRARLRKWQSPPASTEQRSDPMTAALITSLAGCTAAGLTAALIRRHILQVYLAR